jgi:pyridoxal phosphate enzyme (YggS family)
MLSTAQNPPEYDLASRLANLRERIALAAGTADRDARQITLLAVSKGQPAARIQAAAALGLTDFGENYVTEALPKIAQLAGQGLRWHFIGRIQANKTRVIASQFDWVHGIDRLQVAQRLSAQRGHFAAPLQVCLQVNVLGEASKAGVAPADLPTLIDAVRPLPRLALRGLMCMLPYEATLAVQAEGFGCLRQLLEAARARGLALDTLSMGMSDDMDCAIRQGSTLLRIGTALFGPRDASLTNLPVE